MDMAEMLEEIDGHGFQNVSGLRKTRAINQAYVYIVQLEDWPFLEDWSGATIASTGSIRFTDSTLYTYKNIRSVLKIWDTQTGQTLKPIREEELATLTFAGLQGTGNPLYYYVLPNEIWSFPVPAVDDTTWNLMYIAEPKPLLANALSVTTNGGTAQFLPAAWHNLLIHGALSYLYLAEGDMALSDKHEQVLERGIERMRKTAWLRTDYDKSEYIHDLSDFEDYADTDIY